MAWMVVIISVFVLWIASLCKILHMTWSASKSTFLNAGNNFPKKNILLVIAHPDDESMFFTPTINYLASRGHNLHIVCMSTGNADGMGSLRSKELYLAAAVLKIPIQQVKILDHPELQDGFGKVWSSDLVAIIAEEAVLSNNINLIITFDKYGVSGHCNHRDVNNGIRKLMQDDAERDIEAWELVSTNILRKYSGPLDVWLSLVLAMYNKNGELYCLLNAQPHKSYAAMAQHESQWVWYVPEAFCVVFQLHLCEYTKEDQQVGEWEVVDMLK
ncbi:N-acetylglucosaminylphosphatidylinositol deacetylase [Bertholletia excelsa]